MFDKINNVYLSLGLIFLSLLSFIFKWETTILLVVITLLQVSYVVVVKAYEHGRKIEPEDDAAGNTNISKKFIDHM